MDDSFFSVEMKQGSQVLCLCQCLVTVSCICEAGDWMGERGTEGQATNYSRAASAADREAAPLTRSFVAVARASTEGEQDALKATIGTISGVTLAQIHCRCRQLHPMCWRCNK